MAFRRSGLNRALSCYKFNTNFSESVFFATFAVVKTQNKVKNTPREGEVPRTGRRMNREIMRLALPAVVSNVTVPLLGLTDTAVSGHLGSSTYIGAIAVGSLMLNVAFWLFGFLRMGTTGLVAEAFGARDCRRIRRLLTMSLCVGLLFGLLFILLRAPLSDLLLSVLAPGSNVDALARSYFNVCVFGAPALLGTMSVNGWFVGMQSTVRAMTVSITTNVINILLSVWFVFGTGIGFIGVAYGTLCAQWFGLLFALAMAWPLFRRYRPARDAETKSTYPRGLKADFKRFFGVNVNLFFRSACVMAVSMTITSVGSRLGDVTLAANAVMMQFFIFFSYFMDGFAFAGEALVGRSKGSGDNALYRLSVKWLLIWSAVMGTIFFTVYAIAATDIASLITDDRAVIAHVSRYRLWLVLIPVLTVMAFIFDGFFIGLTRTGSMLAVTLTATAVFFAICFVPVGGSYLPSNGRLWSAFLTYLFLRGFLLAIRLPHNLPARSTEVSAK